jgi:hypothetical protein
MFNKEVLELVEKRRLWFESLWRVDSEDWTVSYSFPINLVISFPKLCEW